MLPMTSESTPLILRSWTKFQDLIIDKCDCAGILCFVWLLFGMLFVSFQSNALMHICIILHITKYTIRLVNLDESFLYNGLRVQFPCTCYHLPSKYPMDKNWAFMSLEWKCGASNFWPVHLSLGTLQPWPDLFEPYQKENQFIFGMQLIV